MYKTQSSAVLVAPTETHAAFIRQGGEWSAAPSLMHTLGVTILPPHLDCTWRSSGGSLGKSSCLRPTFMVWGME